LGQNFGPFSSYLRSRVAFQHRQVEQVGDLPASVTDIAGYADCLSMFQAIFAPLENQLAAFDDWQRIGIDFEARRRSPALHLDLSSLGRCETNTIDLAAGPKCFPEALGALYVLEGSTLGGRVILADISSRLGASIKGATKFLEGHGANAGSMWLSFRKALDGYAIENASMAERIVDGAIQSFQLFADAMRARRQGVFSLSTGEFQLERTRK
jgi:heme oxygenase